MRVNGMTELEKLSEEERRNPWVYGAWCGSRRVLVVGSEGCGSRRMVVVGSG